jgi:hypothetical protein
MKVLVCLVKDIGIFKLLGHFRNVFKLKKRHRSSADIADVEQGQKRSGNQLRERQEEKSNRGIEVAYRVLTKEANTHGN